MNVAERPGNLIAAVWKSSAGADLQCTILIQINGLSVFDDFVVGQFVLILRERSELESDIVIAARSRWIDPRRGQRPSKSNESRHKDCGDEDEAAERSLPCPLSLYLLAGSFFLHKCAYR